MMTVKNVCCAVLCAALLLRQSPYRERLGKLKTKNEGRENKETNRQRTRVDKTNPAQPSPERRAVEVSKEKKEW